MYFRKHSLANDKLVYKWLKHIDQSNPLAHSQVKDISIMAAKEKSRTISINSGKFLPILSDNSCFMQSYYKYCNPFIVKP